uniref:Uncharacterized protein n=1 Tax=Romanomermis culicivorax TaxID=13658 RepID=A0A915HZZ6_ROMCU
MSLMMTPTKSPQRSAMCSVGQQSVPQFRQIQNLFLQVKKSLFKRMNILFSNKWIIGGVG